jgi:TRAP transporter TAXI family solute receptor
MKRRLLLTAVPAFSLSFAAIPAWSDTAQKPMVVSSGITTGTYFRLMKEFNEASPGLIVNAESDGSLTNIDRVMDNQAELGITQFDALYYRAMKEMNLKERIRILALLHSEEIHFIAKSAPRTEGGTFGFNPKIVHLNSVDDLRGRKIGFWGGAVTTELIIASIALTGWDPVECQDEKAAIEALKKDQIDALVAVGGQPLGWVSELSHDYKLLSVSDSMTSRLAQVYDKTTLTYRNLGQEGVQTLSVRAMLVTRNYTSKSKHDQLQMLHDKLEEVIGDIRETRGTHPKWGEIDPDATTDKWPMYLSVKQ